MQVLRIDSARGGFPLRFKIGPAARLRGHRLRFGPAKKIDGFRVVKIETAAPPFGRLAVTVGQSSRRVPWTKEKKYERKSVAEIEACEQ